MAFAHSRNDRGVRHDLVDHLRGVATLAGEFAEPVEAAALGHFSSLRHGIDNLALPGSSVCPTATRGGRRTVACQDVQDRCNMRCDLVPYLSGDTATLTGGFATLSVCRG
jgi:hypothetical protein